MMVMRANFGTFVTCHKLDANYSVIRPFVVWKEACRWRS
jgi:hypothetical protein